MKCRDLRPLLVRYVDGEVEGYEQILIQQHLMNCKACTAAVSELKLARQRFQREIKSWAASAVPPATARERLLAKLAAEKETPEQAADPDKRLFRNFGKTGLLGRIILIGLLVMIAAGVVLLIVGKTP